MKLSRPWLWLLLILPLGLGIARLRFDVEILNLLPQKLAVAQGLKLYQQNFSNARELIITLEAPTGDEAEAAARSLAQWLRGRTNLVAAVTWQPAWMENPAQAMELVAYLWLNQPPAVFGGLTNHLARTNLPIVLNEAREQMATSLSPSEIGMRGYDPYNLMKLPESVSGATPAMGTGEELFASGDGTFRLIFVEAKPDIVSYRACRSWLEAIHGAIAEARASGQIPAQAQLHFTGRPPFVTEIAGGMEHDMAGSAGGTMAVIGILFWLTHRRLRPLLWLLLLLLVILGGTTALGGLFLGTLNVVSMGFAAILAGLAEDFGIVIYQESRSHPELNARELRREVAPGIFWSATTTAGAFLILNLSVLPGLGQLGTLVAIGIILAAVVMLYGYLPPLLRLRRKRDLGNDPQASKERFLLFAPQRLLPPPVVWMITALLLAAAAGLLWKQGLRFDHSPNVLQPKNSEATAALEQIKARFGRLQEPLWVLVPGRDESQVARRLVEVNATLSQAVSNHLIADFTLPTALWPQPEHQRANRPAVGAILRERGLMRSAALNAGFMTNALFATESILDCWERAAARTNVFWPTNRASHWILGKIVARTPANFLALGLIHPTNAAATRKFAADWPARLQQEGVILSGWELLGTTVFDVVVKEMPRVMIPIFLLVVVSLWLAFRNLKEVALSLITLAFSGLCLGAAMNLLNWNWNILNLMALPLLLGMGVDFSIHIQLALRRYEGDVLAVRRSVGRALLLAGATTVAGFGSLAFSTNAGMASLGKVCALGIMLALVTAVYLLPVWWKTWKGSASWIMNITKSFPGLWLALFANWILIGCSVAREPDFAAARQRMVAEQLAGRDITNQHVLRVMRTVPRHELVPISQRGQAYGDHPLPIGHEQTISQPYIVAFMTQALDPRTNDIVLEIGTGSGYQAAVLAGLVKQVYTIEIVEPLARRAEADLKRLAFTNVQGRAGDGYQGWPDAAPFDAIIVTCAPDHVPQPLIDQLKEGGRMIIPVGPAYDQSLYLLRKEGGKVRRQAVLPVRFVPMTGQSRESKQ